MTIVLVAQSHVEGARYFGAFWLSRNVSRVTARDDPAKLEGYHGALFLIAPDTTLPEEHQRALHRVSDCTKKRL